LRRWTLMLLANVMRLNGQAPAQAQAMLEAELAALREGRHAAGAGLFPRPPGAHPARRGASRASMREVDALMTAQLGAGHPLTQQKRFSLVLNLQATDPDPALDVELERLLDARRAAGGIQYFSMVSNYLGELNARRQFAKAGTYAAESLRLRDQVGIDRDHPFYGSAVAEGFAARAQAGEPGLEAQLDRFVEAEKQSYYRAMALEAKAALQLARGDCAAVRETLAVFETTGDPASRLMVSRFLRGECALAEGRPDDARCCLRGTRAGRPGRAAPRPDDRRTRTGPTGAPHRTCRAAACQRLAAAWAVAPRTLPRPPAIPGGGNWACAPRRTELPVFPRDCVCRSVAPYGNRPMSRFLLPLLLVSTLGLAAEPGKPDGAQPPIFELLGSLPGGLDTSFNTTGKVTIAVDPTPTLEDHGLISAPRAGGGYFVYGYLPPSGDLVVNARTDAGAIDLSFGVNGRVIHGADFLTVEDALIDDFGRVIIVGNTRPPGAPVLAFDPYLCRFLATGFPDTTFGVGGGFCRSYPVNAVADGSDYATAATTDGGAIYVAGQVQRDTQDDYDFLVLKIRDSDGTLVTAFNGDGILYIPFDINSVGPGGDTDGALAIARDGGAGLYVGGYADNDGDFDNDWVIAKVDIFSGDYFTGFCANTTDCPGGDRLNGRRHQPIITSFGGNSEQIQDFAIGTDGNLVTVVQRYTQVNGNSVQQIETIKLNPTTGATIAGQRDARTYLNFASRQEETDSTGQVHPGVASPRRVRRMSGLGFAKSSACA
jgi:hypothetical protein